MNDDYPINIVNETDIDPELIVTLLRNVFDPEIHFSIYDMGLIYKLEITKEKIVITMTLTSINCPEAQSLPDEVFQSVQQDFPNHEVVVDITFEPPWTVDNMNDAVKLKLGLL